MGHHLDLQLKARREDATLGDGYGASPEAAVAHPIMIHDFERTPQPGIGPCDCAQEAQTEGRGEEHVLEGAVKSLGHVGGPSSDLTPSDGDGFNVEGKGLGDLLGSHAGLWWGQGDPGGTRATYWSMNRTKNRSLAKLPRAKPLAPCL